MLVTKFSRSASFDDVFRIKGHIYSIINFAKIWDTTLAKRECSTVDQSAKKPLAGVEDFQLYTILPRQKSCM